MVRYLANRFAYTVLMMWGVVTVSFFLVRLIPGDPARVMLGQRADQATLEALREQYGFNKPLYVQYWRYLQRLVVGDLGRSIASNRPVLEIVMDRLPATALLASVAMVIATVLGIVAGVFAALKPQSWLDSTLMALSQFGFSVPSIVMAVFFVVLFGELLPWFPIAGYVDRGIEYLVLPAVTLGIRPLAIIARVTRSSMLEVLGQDYIRTAHAKGLPRWQVVLYHALRNALNPVVTTVGTWFAGLLAGTYFVEYIFNWPGIGSAAFDAITKLDYPVIQGTVLFTALVFVVVNFFSDVLYALLDPRVELYSKSS